MGLPYPGHFAEEQGHRGAVTDLEIMDALHQMGSRRRYLRAPEGAAALAANRNWRENGFFDSQYGGPL